MGRFAKYEGYRDRLTAFERGPPVWRPSKGMPPIRRSATAIS
ncbi:hypothetical protein N599_25355 [Saccharopolyspora erythraea D]|nr:hypothetical protein N599_25355 [Saccharopolyspora erythraea D]